MFDKAEYWIKICDEDIVTSKWLWEGNRLLHCGFFCHLIAEKSLKAVIARNTGRTPPKIHDLIKLARLGKVYDNLSEKHLGLIEELDQFQIEARYPEYRARIAKTLTKGKMERIFTETEDFLCWIKKRLGQ